MMPPRYLLREYCLKRIYPTLPRGRFLELGYGDGTMLVLLHREGFAVEGYDPSPMAFTEAQEVVSHGRAADIHLLKSLDRRRKYHNIGFFEVIGYWQDPLGELRRLRRMLAAGGRLIFSFTNKEGAGAAEKYSGQMRCFGRDQILRMLSRAGLRADLCWNYGFPLTAMMRPLLHSYYEVLHRLGKTQDGAKAVEQSGLAHKRSLVGMVAALILNRLTIWPFCIAQMAFRGSDLGSGYIVVAACAD